MKAHFFSAYNAYYDAIKVLFMLIFKHLQRFLFFHVCTRARAQEVATFLRLSWLLYKHVFNVAKNGAGRNSRWKRRAFRNNRALCAPRARLARNTHREEKESRSIEEVRCAKSNAIYYRDGNYCLGFKLKP